MGERSVPTRRQVLAMTAAAAASAPLRTGLGSGLSTAARHPKRILTLVRDAASNSMRAVERVVWVAK